MTWVSCARKRKSTCFSGE